jgi:hypothetical protein
MPFEIWVKKLKAKTGYLKKELFLAKTTKSKRLSLTVIFYFS